MSTSTVRLKLPAYHPGQAKIESELQRFNILACGRRFGKDVYEMNKVVEPAIRGYKTGFAAPTYKVLSENWREVNHLLAPMIQRRDAQERRLELKGGGVIDFWSLDNPDMIRGRKYKRFVINEAGFVPNLMDIWNFIIRATLVDMEGDAIIGGTPKGRNGFWQMFQYGKDELMPEWACWQMSSYENPYIPKSELDEMTRTLPEMVVRQEIFAEFLEDAGGVFRRVMDAATAEEQPEPEDGHEYILGVDWGQMVDFTVIIVLDITTNSVAFIDRFNQIDYILQSDRLKAIVKRYKPTTIIAEVNAMGQPIIERLLDDGLPIQPFTTTNATKAEVIRGLQNAFENGEIKILPDDVLIGELQAYEQERTTTGLWKFGAPEGMHDDTVIALALAWHGGAKWYF